MDGRPHTAYIASNVGDRAAKASSARRLMVRSGWSSGTRISMSMNASMLTCGSCSPRIPTTSLRDGSTVSGAPISPEEPQPTKVGVFHQPASGTNSLSAVRRCNEELSDVPLLPGIAKQAKSTKFIVHPDAKREALRFRPVLIEVPVGNMTIRISFDVAAFHGSKLNKVLCEQMPQNRFHADRSQCKPHSATFRHTASYHGC